MTLCIAAHCQESGFPRVVLCFDRKGSSELGSAETLFKYEELTAKVCALVAADDMSAARELVSLYKHHLSASSMPDNLADIMEYLRIPIASFKARERSEYVRSKLGRSLEEIEQRLAEQPNNAQYERVLSESEHVGSRCELLLVGWMDSRFRIFRCFSQNGTVTLCDNFGCIGEGAYISQPLLQYRNQAEYDTLSSAIYKVYEAKKIAEVNDSVGSAANLLVLSIEPTYPDHVLVYGIGKAGPEYLKARFEQYGPKDVPMLLDFPVHQMTGPTAMRLDLLLTKRDPSNQPPSPE